MAKNAAKDLEQGKQTNPAEKLSLVTDFRKTLAYKDLAILRYTKSSNGLEDPIVLDPHVDSLIAAIDETANLGSNPHAVHFFINKIIRSLPNMTSSLDSGLRAGWLKTEDEKPNERAQALASAISLITPLVEKLEA